MHLGQRYGMNQMCYSALKNFIFRTDGLADTMFTPFTKITNLAFICRITIYLIKFLISTVQHMQQFNFFLYVSGLTCALIQRKVRKKKGEKFFHSQFEFSLATGRRLLQQFSEHSTAGRRREKKIFCVSVLSDCKLLLCVSYISYHQFFHTTCCRVHEET